MQEEERPDLIQLASTMASNQAKAAGYIQTLAGSVDELIAASTDEDWDKVRHLSGEIAEQSRASGYRAVSALAQRVFDEAHQPNNPVGIKRSLIRLVGTSGRMGRSETQNPG